MQYGIEIKTTLIADNGKRFNVGQDISFTMLDKKSNTREKYIGNIRRIDDDFMIIDHIEINRMQFHNSMCMKIYFTEIDKNSCNYVSVD